MRDTPDTTRAQGWTAPLPYQALAWEALSRDRGPVVEPTLAMPKRGDHAPR